LSFLIEKKRKEKQQPLSQFLKTTLLVYKKKLDNQLLS
jgi:hypothetical protein